MKNAKVNDKFQEPLFLAMELLRAGVLHNGRIGTRAYSGGPNFTGGTEADKRSMLLVMRVLSIVPLVFTVRPSRHLSLGGERAREERELTQLVSPLQPGAWNGPLSRELLVFNSFLRATSRSMRNLLEAIAVNCLLRGDAQRSYADYLGVAFSLPFQADTNTGMGILFKAFGDTVCHMAGGIEVVARTANGAGGASAAATKEEREAIQQSKDQVLGLLQDAFPNVKNVRAELERGFRFWNLVRRRSPLSLSHSSSSTLSRLELTLLPLASRARRSCSPSALCASLRAGRRSRPSSPTASRRRTSG